ESTDRIALRLTEVRKSFGAVKALKGVSLEVRAGEVHALLGENGAGKSTLMAVAAGSLQPDEGAVEISGERLDAASPSAAQALGLGVVYQHPALADDLTVAENMVLAMPRKLRPSHGRSGDWVRERLAALGAESIDPSSRVGELTAAEGQLVEIAKALALDPTVLILDEPTAALDAEEVTHLFEQVRAIRARGTAIVYISHRIPEVEEIADRLTVLRDGEARGTFGVEEVDEAAILKLIAGRALTAVFPDKLEAGQAGETVLKVEDLSGEGFDDVSLEVHEGEIVGVAGVAGNGQRELVRALAGLGHASSGTVTVNGAEVNLANPRRAQGEGVFYIPSDRQREGIFPALSVRENAVASALGQFTSFGIVAPGPERAALATEEKNLAIKTPSPEADIANLSGGNQQKVAFARAMLGRPRVLICDEPTQGVDVGARVEIYRLLRELAADGCAILVCSSDALELEGLCDRVMIMSRGQTVAALATDAVSEEQITAAAVTATHSRKVKQRETRGSVGWLGRFLRGDSVAAPVLALVIVALAAITGGQNSDFLTSFNIENLLLLSTALILVGLGQLVVVLTAGVDLSVGPLMGLGLVIITAFATDTAGTGGFFVGLLLAVAAGAAVGLVNGGLIQFARINPVIATLATFIGVQGVALLINPVPTGLFSGEAAKTLSTAVGGVPVAFIVVVVLGLGAELALRRSRLGLSLRAVGSDEAAAHRMGIRVGTTKMIAYVICAVFASLAALMLAVQIGTGDATAGQNYTLQSIAAVVLGGASIYGGRGSFVGTVLGALLLTEMINAITFLELSDAWQYWFPGAIILIAAAIYARASRIRLAAAAADPA
ncbi:MAG TPA: ATP-binding cassette domain-containing protein, partial [Solirubrobacterales bacterium]|nr:ATP-binding cassette domain-containing protein [Solirubrobacterales bacterium]